jgi:hypothetical protein
MRRIVPWTLVNLINYFRDRNHAFGNSSYYFAASMHDGMPLLISRAAFERDFWIRRY